jgi:hypothetical protein
MPFDLGLLAETLVFYQHVNLVADGDMLKSLLRVCGPDSLLALIQDGSLSLAYVQNHLAYVQNHIGSLRINDNTSAERHDFALIDFPGRTALQEVLPKFLQEITGRSGRGRRLAKRLSDLILEESYDKSVVDGARADLKDTAYAQEAVSRVLRYLVPEYDLPEPFEFTVDSTDGRLRVETNIDFARADELYQRRFPSANSRIDKDFLLLRLAGVRGVLHLGARVSSDLAISPLDSIVATCRFTHLLRERAQNDDVLRLFQEFVFTDGRTIREAVNSGQRTFADVVRLAAAARKFKDWLKGKPSSRDLLREYCGEVSRIDWAERLPSKSIRWVLFTGVSTLIGVVAHPLAAAVAGVTLSAADTFLTDKLIKGWKPNQFVSGPLTEFVGRDRAGTPP